jgi:8-oxo-dGTP pyrophosphatase MutT (NUDIX family)
MPGKSEKSSAEKTPIETKDQVSAGGVAFRRVGSRLELAIVSVKPGLRWQLPKGIVDRGETFEVTAAREVREEAGIETDVLRLIETIQYWYQRVQYGKRIRYHKYVHFYLLQYRAGDGRDHDGEIAESRWVSFDEAMEMLAFKSERGVVEKARKMIERLGKDK